MSNLHCMDHEIHNNNKKPILNFPSRALLDMTNTAIRSNWNVLIKQLQNFKNFLCNRIYYWLTGWLMSPDKHNLTRVKSHNFSLFDIAFTWEIPFWHTAAHICTMDFSWIYQCLLFVSYSYLLTWFCGSTWWLPYTMEIIHIFHSDAILLFLMQCTWVNLS